ncbi:molybdopterin-dependent oxidoreductase [Hoeflea prorocentri]|uniref:Molybdopterin-dependent oxidoreductase n=1 Tax=Hoeflea prorocentri TaxID=1922333 RepID=A0A9X3UI56_9HYPH|nr:molybdopterin-dependent oxidoreductase [Hoeflea prorocentri]MCY6381767.1 molybdopterin-dependent oxidoreductase [Hoeflea prorocentri]MDA5399567.1 molybdopterin-dependent oxidoreductase [Hoeflea prorocentri]
MKYTAAHWGVCTIDGQGNLHPLEDDPEPSRIARGWASAAKDPRSRILAPAVRKGWLEGDRGADRCDDSFVEIGWDRAADLVAQEISRVRDNHGNGAIFGGSYGWASAGRFHHAQSQLKRFLNLAGGCVSSRDTYSHAAAEVLFPHMMGRTYRQFQDRTTGIQLVEKHCEVLLAVGGLSSRTAQIASAGTSHHEIGGWLERILEKGMRVVNVSPMKSDLKGGEWLSIRPGTDTAFLLALIYEIIDAGLENRAFIDRYTSGWGAFEDYVMGRADNHPKTAEWAAGLCDIPAGTIRSLAHVLATRRSMIAMAWSLQRADHGEQPLWAGLALACAIGQIGQPGTGYAFGYGSVTATGRSIKLIPWPSFRQGSNPVDDFIPVARIADMLLSPGKPYRYNLEDRKYPDIKLVYWAGGNPFHHHQDLHRLEEAWTRPETVIVHDHSWTATARRADIVLPATTPLERNDIMMNRRDPSLIYMSPSMQPMGEALDDFEIFRRISSRLGFEEQFTEGLDVEGWLRRLWSQSVQIAEAHGIMLPEFDEFSKAGRFEIPDSVQHHIGLQDYIEDPDANPLDTESGRLVVFSERIDALGLDGCPGHPAWFEPAESLLDAQEDELHLLSGQPDTRLHSQNDRGNESRASKIRDREPAYMHPQAAEKRGLSEGDIIRIFNERGACLAGLKLDDAMRVDCLALATGAWYDPQIVEGERLEVHGNPNVLTIDKGTSDLSQGNIAHTALVRVEKWLRDLPPLSVDRPPQLDAAGSG